MSGCTCFMQFGGVTEHDARCPLATPTPQAQAGDDGLQGVWPHPISGWVRGADFIAASGDDAESRLAHGWQPVSHVPPSFVFDPSPQAPARDAGAVAPYAWCLRTGRGDRIHVGPTPPECLMQDAWKPLYTHPAAASDDARLFALAMKWRSESAKNITHHMSEYRASAQAQARCAVELEAALSSPDGLRKGDNDV